MNSYDKGLSFMCDVALMQESLCRSHKVSRILFLWDLKMLLSTGSSCWNQRQFLLWDVVTHTHTHTHTHAHTHTHTHTHTLTRSHTHTHTHTLSHTHTQSVLHGVCVCRRICLSRYWRRIWMEVLESFSRFMMLTHTCCIWLGRCRTSQCDTLTHYKHNIYMNIH